MDTVIHDEVPEVLLRKQARANPRCIVCGVENPNGLHLHFDIDNAGAHANWTPTAQWESFETTIHGGIIGAVLDEAMSQAVIARKWEALTAELTVRFRRQITPGEQLQVHGWVVERKKRHITAEAVINSGCNERAHAWGKFLVPDEPTRRRA